MFSRSAPVPCAARREIVERTRLKLDAILEPTIVNRLFIDARPTLAKRESELVPAGKRWVDTFIKEWIRGTVQNAEGA